MNLKNKDLRLNCWTSMSIQSTISFSVKVLEVMKTCTLIWQESIIGFCISSMTLIYGEHTLMVIFEEDRKNAQNSIHVFFFLLLCAALWVIAILSHKYENKSTIQFVWTIIYSLCNIMCPTFVHHDEAFLSSFNLAKY